MSQTTWDQDTDALCKTLTASGGVTAATLTGAISSTGDTTLADGKNIIVGSTTGTMVATATTQKLAFHGATPVTQRAGAARAAIVATGSTNITPYGFATAAQADAIVTLANELRAALVAKGIIKGAA